MKKFSRNAKKIYFKPDFYYETTRDFCLHLGYNAQDVAELTGVSVQTARRWIRSDNPPRWLLPFLYATSGRVLAPGFDGWLFKDGTLAARGFRFTLSASQIQAYTWHLEQISIMQLTIGRLKKAIAQEKEKPQQKAAVIHFKDFKK